MNKVEITVDGGYKPSEVKVKVGEPVKLVFNRIEFELDTSKAGEVDFACGMNMFKGKVVIE